MTKVILNSGNLDFVNILSIYLENSYTLKKKVKLFILFFTMKIIIAAVYGNEFVTSSQDYIEKIMHIKGRLKGKYHVSPRQKKASQNRGQTYSRV
jgi:hypothetical protein